MDPEGSARDNHSISCDGKKGRRGMLDRTRTRKPWMSELWLQQASNTR